MHGGLKQELECALYVVATPIGNLGDITLRALGVLGSVNVVAAEDTRNTLHLLNHHGIRAPRLLALHQHNERAAAEQVVARLQQGDSVALVSDAGTPAISDPGALLVAAVRAAGLRVVPIPGANAALAALSASGLTNPHFLFYGFLPAKAAARRQVLQELAAQPHTLVFYEAPHRVQESVADLLDVLGPARDIVFARELTKMFENIKLCKLSEAAAWLASDTNNLRGEFVLLVSGAAAADDQQQAEAERILAVLIEELPLKQAVQLSSKISGFSKNKLYQYALAQYKSE